MNRRVFIRNASLALAAAPGVVSAADEAGARSIIAVARNEKVILGPNKLDAKVVRELVDAAVATAAGEARPRDAWRKLFKPADRVGIKINTLSGPMMSSHPLIVAAVAAALRDAGIEARNIIVWDRLSDELTRAGYEVKTKNVRDYVCIATDGRYPMDAGAMLEHGEIGSFLSPLLTLCTAVISLPILKDHDLAGVTCGMKNFFGAIHNPNKYHFANKHDAISDLSCSAPIRERLRLTICDATRACYEAGPGYKPQFTERPGMIIASLDPVAVDHVAWLEIEKMRSAHGKQTLAKAGREPLFIARAAAKKLGTNDTNKMKVVKL